MKRIMATTLMGAAFAIAGGAPMAFADTKSPAPTTTTQAPAPAPTTTTQAPAPAPAPAKPAAAPKSGQFCKKDLEGKSAKAGDGTALTCTAGSDGKDRWTKK